MLCVPIVSAIILVYPASPHTVYGAGVEGGGVVTVCYSYYYYN